MHDLSEAQHNANIANAQLSHGPVTPEGKARSSMNAYRHGLTARKIVISDEDLPLYQEHVQSFLDRYQPQSIDERALVQIVADCHWRIDRAMNIEDSLKLKLTVEVLEGGSLTNLSLYLTRIFNMMNRSLKQLEQIHNQRQAQAKRQEEEAKRQEEEALRQREEAILLARYFKMLEQPFDPQENGFVFSASELAREIARRELLEEAAKAEKYGFHLASYRNHPPKGPQNKAA
jgi:hypothetical protein